MDRLRERIVDTSLDVETRNGVECSSRVGEIDVDETILIWSVPVQNEEGRRKMIVFYSTTTLSEDKRTGVF